MTDLTPQDALAEGRETRMQVRRWFVETGWVDGNGIGLWDGTDESVEVSSRAVAEALRDEWLASGKIERDQWGNLRRTGPYGDFRIRSVWNDVPGELIPETPAQAAWLRKLRDEGPQEAMPPCRERLRAMGYLKIDLCGCHRDKITPAGLAALEAYERGEG